MKDQNQMLQTLTTWYLNLQIIPLIIKTLNKQITIDNIQLIITYWCRNSSIDVINVIGLYYPFSSWYLIRECSSYSNEDILLGIFTSKHKAIKGKQEYIEITNGNDPYQDQIYHTVDLNKDIKIYKYEHFTAYNVEQVYVICRLGCGLGHHGRPILGFCTKEIFDTTFKRLVIENPQNRFGFLYDVVETNKIRFHNDNSKKLDMTHKYFDNYILRKMENKKYTGFTQPISH
eukprot:325618_1